MGAIAGIIYPEIFPVTYAIKPALDALGARSAGKEETLLHKNVELGARGAPIAFSPHRTVALLLDGRLTGIQELAKELLKAGVKVRDSSPEQLIIHAYEVWEEDFLRHLHGNFSLALFDIAKHQLILGRDRLGQKPLYWAYYNRYFVFASELKAILATGLVPQTPAPEGLAAYLYLGYLPQDLSPIEQVNKLLPAHYLKIGPHSPLAVRSYWSYSASFSEPKQEAQEGALEAHLKASFQDTTKAGAYIATGDLGSAYIASQLAASDQQATGYALHFPNENDSEVDLALDIATRLGLNQQTITVTPDSLLRSLTRVVWQLDEPLTSPIPYAMWSLYDQAADSMGILTEVGIEAILAAHRPLSPTTSKGVYSSVLSRPLLSLFGWMRPQWAYGLLSDQSVDPWLTSYLEGQALFTGKLAKRVSPISQRFTPEIFFRRIYQLSQLAKGPASQMYLDVKTSLCDREALPHDRLASAHGTAWFSPYLTEDVVTYMAQVPEEHKALLVEEQHPLRKLLPESLQDLSFQRRSSRRTDFLNPWIHDAGLQRLWSLLLDGSLVESGFVSRRWLRQALQRRTKPPVTFQQLWGILVLEVWFQLFINHPIRSEPPSLTAMELLRS